MANNLICIKDFENESQTFLDRNAREFINVGADDEVTLRENELAFNRWAIRPRMLVDVSIRNLETEVLGKKVSFPLGLSPGGIQKIAHSDGEVAAAKACEEMGTIFCLSTVASCSIEEVALSAPNCRKWFQLYVYKERKLSEDLVIRAEKAGYEAIILTTDAVLVGKRRANWRNKFILPFRLPNLEYSETTYFTDVDHWFDQNLTWDDINWLRKLTKLPIIVKGVFGAEDAKLAVKYGADAIWITNHGGRQIDTCRTTIDILPEVVEAVKGQCEIYIDSGFRKGSDVFKGLALGAKMVFTGRPLYWGLSLGGKEGVKKVLKIYKDELDMVMCLSGTPEIKNINSNFVKRNIII